MKQFEHTPTVAESQPELKRLEAFIETAAAESRAQGIPLCPDGRIDMLAYKAIYPEAGENLAHTREGQLNAEALRKERMMTDGEKLEMLAYALFCKYFGSDFVIARSSPHDDKVNGVDTIILEKATGNLVCAFDEVGATGGADYEKKQDLVRDHNVNGGGATLKYGFQLEKKNGEKKIVPGAVTNVPLFYFALPKDRIEKGISTFSSSLNDHPDFEKKLFEYFIAAITLQVRGLDLTAGA